MSRVLILGSAGMLGHKVLQATAADHDVTATIRGGLAEHPAGSGLLSRHRVVDRIDAGRPGVIEELVRSETPDVVVNCIGVIKQRAAAQDPIQSISINALLPHRLADVCLGVGARLVHFGTDCVFSGRRGDYAEDDVSDAEDLYGRTKFLGEVIDSSNAVTLRTSIVGRELTHFDSLVEWFLAQRGTVKGFRRAVYTGVTTNYLAAVVGRLITEYPDLHGLYQLAGPKITKHDLLLLLRDAYRTGVEIVPDDEVVVDRSLVRDRLVETTGIVPPDWPTMIADMAADPTPYHLWR